MTNKRLYEIMKELGMVDENSVKVFCPESPCVYASLADEFANTTAKDLISIINFVDELALYNDLETIKKLLVVLIMELNKNLDN